MIVEAASSSGAGIANAIFTGVLATIVAAAALITAIKAPRVARRNRTIDETAKDVKQIHVLVDGNLTASIGATLDATRRELIVLREVARLHEEAGRAPDPDTRAEIARTTTKVAELEQQIVARLALDVAAAPKNEEQP